MITITLEEGTDLTSVLSILKYEPQLAACLMGEAKGTRPAYVPKTDEDRVQAVPQIIEEFKGKKVYVSQKIDGTSSSFSYRRCEQAEGGEFEVCSRNLNVKENADNTYWKMAKRYDIMNKLADSGGSYCIQGEIAGMGIQKNPMGLPDVQLFVFNVVDLSTGRFLDCENMLAFCAKYELQTVPILMKDVEFKWNMEELLALADASHYPNGRINEGIVIRPMVEFYSDALKGRASFKVVSNKYLEKFEE